MKISVLVDNCREGGSMGITKKTRKEKWLEKGYTPEQIESNLQFERHKSKLSRERRKRNNEQNKEKINEIKKDLQGITFTIGNKSFTIHTIRPSTDGIGFWYTYTKEFEDGSFGKFREFLHFDDYKYVDFIEYLRY